MGVWIVVGSLVAVVQAEVLRKEIVVYEQLQRVQNFAEGLLGALHNRVLVDHQQLGEWEVHALHVQVQLTSFFKQGSKARKHLLEDRVPVPRHDGQGQQVVDPVLNLRVLVVLLHVDRKHTSVRPVEVVNGQFHLMGAAQTVPFDLERARVSEAIDRFQQLAIIGLP